MAKNYPKPDIKVFGRVFDFMLLFQILCPGLLVVQSVMENTSALILVWDFVLF